MTFRGCDLNWRAYQTRERELRLSRRNQARADLAASTGRPLASPLVADSRLPATSTIPSFPSTSANLSSMPRSADGADDRDGSLDDAASLATAGALRDVVALLREDRTARDEQDRLDRAERERVRHEDREERERIRREDREADERKWTLLMSTLAAQLGHRDPSPIHTEQSSSGFPPPPSRVSPLERNSDSPLTHTSGATAGHTADSLGWLGSHGGPPTSRSPPVPADKVLLLTKPDILPLFSNDGSVTAREFLDRAQGCIDSGFLTADNLLKQIGFRLRGPASDWYQLCRSQIISWSDFTTRFRRMFGGAKLEEELRRQLKMREQRENEPIREFALDITGLCRKINPNVSDAKVAKKVLAALNPLLKEKMTIPSSTALTVESLVEEGTRVETIFAEQKQYLKRMSAANQSSTPPPPKTPFTGSGHVPNPPKAYSSASTSPSSAVRPDHRPSEDSPKTDDSQSRKFRPICNYCRRYGHTIEDCLKRQQRSLIKEPSASGPTSGSSSTSTVSSKSSPPSGNMTGGRQ